MSRVVVPDLRRFRVTVPAVVVTDSDVDVRVDELRVDFAVLLDVDRPARAGDVVRLSVYAEGPDGPVDELCAAAPVPHVVGRPWRVAGVDDAVVGLTVGQDTHLTVLDGRLHVHVAVHAVREQRLLDVDDPFAQTATAHTERPRATVPELRADVREAIEEQRREDQVKAAREAVLTELLALSHVAVPEMLVAEDAAARLEALENTLYRDGLTLGEWLDAQGKTEDELDGELDAIARTAVKSRLVLDEVANREGVTVTREEVAWQITGLASRVGVTAAEYSRRVGADAVAAAMRRERAWIRVLNAAVVVDTDGLRVDVSRPT